MAATSYRDDRTFLQDHTKLIELTSGKMRIAVAPDFQGRVMTSSFAGQSGAGIGWLNREFIASGQTKAKFNNYGGEDRFWLGPEAGQFGLWFPKGSDFGMGDYQTPWGFNAGPFEVTSASSRSVAMAKAFDVKNYAETTFHVAAKRTVNLLGPGPAAAVLGADVPADLAMVGFETVNTLANLGPNDWTRQGGLLSIWTLGQYKPLPRGRVIVPFVPGPQSVLGVKVTTDYFGALPPERCQIGEDHVLFACDGNFRSKIGISPQRARNVLGSYDPDAAVLTVVQFNLPAAAHKLSYVNSLWKIQDYPYAGDAINSYNDGEEKPGAGSFGGFYELETSSPAAELKAGQAVTHVHRTFHFHGPVDALAGLAWKTLGVDIRRI